MNGCLHAARHSKQKQSIATKALPLRLLHHKGKPMPFRVLVVDDATFVRDTIKRTLRQFIPDVEIFDAADGQRAISLMKGNKIDLILSDWEMPEMTGEELLQWVRSQPSSLKTPFIMVSSRGDRDHVIAAVKAGVSDYLSKPFSPDELKSKVTKQLQKMGHRPSSSSKPPAASSGVSSLDALTNTKNTQTMAQKPQKVTAATGFSQPAAAASKKTSQEAAYFEGKVQLRFAAGTSQCVVRDLSLQAMNGMMVRPQTMPVLFDPVVIDMENDKGEAIARLNAYLHSLQAAEPHPNTQKIKFTVRFVDNDPDKFEVISKMIARSR